MDGVPQPPNGSRLSCGRPASRRKPVGRQSVPHQGHNTPLPLKRSPPASFKRLLGCVLSAPDLWFAGPSGNLVVAKFAQRPKASRHVERTSLGIAPVDVAEKALQFTKLIIPDVVPNLVEREVGPEPFLGATVPTESAPYAPMLPLPSHADVDDIVVVVLGTAVADPSIQHVDAANTARNLRSEERRVGKEGR